MARPLGSKLERYRLRLDSSRTWRKDEGYDDLWQRLIDLYAGKQFEGLSRQDQIAVNIAFSTLNIIYPSTTVNHPKLNLTARDPDDNDKAIIAEAVMDYMWRSEDISAGDEFRLAIKDFLAVGHGWVKTGWRYRTGNRDRDEAAIQDEFNQAVSEADTAATEMPEMAGELPTDADIAELIPTTEQHVIEDRVFVERVSPFDMFVDPEATTTRNMKWIAQRIVRTIDEVKSDKRYDSRARNSAKSDVTAKFYRDERKRRRPTDIERITVWEFYDLTDQTMSVFAEQGEGFLVKPTAIPYKMGQPFIMVRNYEVPDLFYPMGDLEALEPLQQELNRTRSQLMQARKTYARKYLVDEKFLTPAARSALQSDRDGEVIPISLDNTARLSDVILPAPIQQVPAELFSYGEMIQGDANQVSGVSEYQQGGGGDIRRTATEASMIQDATNARSADKLATIEKAIARIGRNMLELARQYLTGDHYARIMGNHGKPIWVPYTQEDIDVDADFEVEGGSTTPKNEGWKQNQAIQLTQALGPLVGQAIDPQQFARFILTSFGVKQPEKFLMQAPMGMPPGMGGPPGMEQMMPPPGAEMPEGAAEPMPMPEEDPMAALPPEVLAQLQSQVGLNL